MAEAGIFNQFFTLELRYGQGFCFWAFAIAEVLVQWFTEEKQLSRKIYGRGFVTADFVIFEDHCIRMMRFYGSVIFKSKIQLIGSRILK